MCIYAFNDTINYKEMPKKMYTGRNNVTRSREVAYAKYHLTINLMRDAQQYTITYGTAKT